METRVYPLTIMQHEETGHYFATCEGLPQFMSHGESLMQLRDNAAQVMHRVLTKKGLPVDTVEVVSKTSNVPEGLAVFDTVAVARIQAAA